MKISSFADGQNIDLVRAEMKAALEAVETKLGIKIDLGRGQYIRGEDSTFKFKDIAVALSNESPYMEGISAQLVLELNKHADSAGKLLHVFNWAGKDCVIVGRHAAKIYFKFLGDPSSSCKAYPHKMNDYRDPRNEQYRAAIAAAKPM